jgi:hypothetical protein
VTEQTIDPDAAKRGPGRACDGREELVCLLQWTERDGQGTLEVLPGGVRRMGAPFLVEGGSRQEAGLTHPAAAIGREIHLSGVDEEVDVRVFAKTISGEHVVAVPQVKRNLDLVLGQQSQVLCATALVVAGWSGYTN